MQGSEQSFFPYLLFLNQPKNNRTRPSETLFGDRPLQTVGQGSRRGGVRGRERARYVSLGQLGRHRTYFFWCGSWHLFLDSTPPRAHWYALSCREIRVTPWAPMLNGWLLAQRALAITVRSLACHPKPSWICHQLANMYVYTHAHAHARTHHCSGASTVFAARNLSIPPEISPSSLSLSLSFCLSLFVSLSFLRIRRPGVTMSRPALARLRR